MKNSGSSVSSAVNWWNRISTWVSGSILCEPNDKAKKIMFKCFMRIVDALLALRNYSSAAQIITGLKHRSVERLVGLEEVSLSITILLC